MKGQRPVRGYLGVGLQPVDEDLAPSLGLAKDTGEIVRTIVADGPAAQGGNRAGRRHREGQRPAGHARPDRLLPRRQFAGRSARPDRGHPQAGTPGAKRGTVYVTLQDRPTEEALSKIGARRHDDARRPTATTAVTPQKALGLSLARLTPELAKAANLPATARGVIITAVDPNSDAAEQGLQRGDLIMSVNNQSVTDPAQVIAGADGARKAGRSSVLLLVKRGNSPEAFIASA